MRVLVLIGSVLAKITPWVQNKPSWSEVWRAFWHPPKEPFS